VRIFDASEGTALDPLKNKSWDLNSPKTVPVIRPEDLSEKSSAGARKPKAQAAAPLPTSRQVAKTTGQPSEQAEQTDGDGAKPAAKVAAKPAPAAPAPKAKPARKPKPDVDDENATN
jgi:hypothetical protein